MAEISVVSVVQLLRDKLSADPPPPHHKILRILQKLSELPMSIDVLHETGIGKVVNGFRKYEGDIAETARSLVRTWKAMVREAMHEEANRQEGSEMPTQTESSPRSNAASKLHSPPKQQSPYAHSLPRSQDVSKPHRPSNSKMLSQTSCYTSTHGSPKSQGSSKIATERKHQSNDASSAREYTQLKEKPSSSSGSPVKKLKSHHSPVSGTAKSHDKRDVETGGKPKSHVSSDKRSVTDSAKPHDRSHDRSHDGSHNKAAIIGVQKSSEYKQTLHSGHSHKSHDKYNSVSSKKTDWKENTTTEKYTTANVELTLESNPKKVTKSIKKENLTTNGEVVSQKSTSTKTDNKGKSASHLSDKIKPRASMQQQEGFNKPQSKLPSSNKKLKDDNVKTDNLDDESDGQNFNNSGMSFGDCLLGPMVTKVKKVTKNKPPTTSKLSLKMPTSTGPIKPSTVGKASAKPASTSSSDPGRAKVKGNKTDPSRAKVNVKSSQKEKSLQGKQAVSESLSGGQRSEEGRRSRKKRSISEEEEEAIKMAKKVRRESTEVSLSLPEIQPNYKPIRLPEVPSPMKKRSLTPEEEMAYLASKQGRTKVFSGRSRINRLTSVPRLYDICMEMLCDNIDALDDVGGVPYDILYPVLQKCTPQQLFHLEDCNPHFLEDTDPLWQKHVEREFKGKQPDEMESWREIYIREYDAREAKLKSITANISAHMAAKDPGRLTKMAFLDRPAKPPRNVLRQQLRHGTASGTFMPEKRSHSTVQPDRSSVVISSSEAEASGLQRRRARPAKIVAPMMMKTLKMIKKLRR
ncbi:elongin-A-like [Acanthaster planci]|uniref:Elongin-A-like n=1 Tax=Acanthaster planci TaxID=133434 RepID=A0A8B7ZHU0_ACAPL|nr:elongin-A-like [Acanthaster planci]XP_022104566.1 elongin-A-like [Acanthaster planci]XP_022104567.1 elongin-A-like [Acanthaster planci]XP_022104568.1 elongin-A-like [Acanthaster planci]